MKRKGVPRQDTSVSLFPFLAVLACTMGALIVLLVMVLQQARVQADVISQRRSQERRSADEKESQRLRELREDCQWRREILEKQRAELLQRLASKRLELSHLEEHIRSLETKWKEIGQSVGELERLRGSKNQDLAAARAELDQLQAAVETATRQLNEAKEQAARQPRSYAVVPYQGPNGTRRRPIYVECLADSIVLQPEGVVFQAEDFNGPLGPGNPLDAALRAVREYWTRQGGSDGEPYPLLIIRPGGAIAYGVARAAMTSWDDEFGYELVGDDLQLVYPPKDPALAEILKKAVADARQRQAILAAAMPSRFSERETVGFRAERHGGLTPVGGTADEDDPWTVESGQFGSAKHPAESSAAGGSRQGGNGTAPQSGPNGGPGGPASDPGALVLMASPCGAWRATREETGACRTKPAA